MTIAPTVFPLDPSLASQLCGVSRTPGVPVTSSIPVRSSTPAVSFQLSDLAKTLMQMFGGQTDAADGTDRANLPANFDEMVTQRTDAFGDRLTKDLAAEGITLDDQTKFNVDKFGNIQVEGPYKKKIEEYFKANPDAAAEFKAVASLNAMKATAKAMQLYSEEMRAAHGKEDRAKAQGHLTSRLSNIQALSGNFTFKDGKLTSAAVEYADALSGPNGKTDIVNSQGVNIVA